jgi:hypothetical protein
VEEDTGRDEKPPEPDPAFPAEPQESVGFQPITPAPAKPNVEPNDEA